MNLPECYEIIGIETNCSAKACPILLDQTTVVTTS
jgi:hypothetical protein